MRILITGGNGLIGKQLSAELARGGHEVIVLSRDLEQVKGLPQDVKAARWDGRSASGWGELVDGAGAIVHLAGENLAGKNLLTIRWTRERKHRILESRVNSGRAVVEAVQAAKNKPGVVIQASAVGFYGPRENQEIDESTSAGRDFPAKVCQEWEASTKPVEALGVRRVVIRTGIVLSKKGGALPRQMLPFHFFAGGPIGSGKQSYPWIHIADVVGAIIFLIESPQANGAFNLTAPQQLNNAEFSKALGKAMHRPAFIPIPGFVFKLLFGEAATILLDGQMAVPAKLTQLGYRFKFPEVNAALADILKGTSQ